MATRPSKFPEWASQDQTDSVSNQNNVVEPPDDRKDSGWNRREIPPRQWFNWLGRITYEWIKALAAENDTQDNDISQNTSNISQNTSNIAANSSDISDNASDISSLQSTQSNQQTTLDNLTQGRFSVWSGDQPSVDIANLSDSAEGRFLVEFATSGGTLVLVSGYYVPGEFNVGSAYHEVDSNNDEVTFYSLQIQGNLATEAISVKQYTLTLDPSGTSGSTVSASSFPNIKNVWKVVGSDV